MDKYKSRSIMIIILLVGVISLSIGLAVFSSTLNIKSGTTVSPDPSKFKIAASASKDNTTSLQISPSAYVLPSGLISNSSTATITNSGNMVTISNVKPYFTAPGQIIEYIFYVHNIGEYPAYLKSYSQFLLPRCVSLEGTTDSLVQQACNDINTGICLLDFNGRCNNSQSDLDKNNYVIPVGGSTKISVRLNYSLYSNRDNVVADGPFTVEFDNINIVFGSQPTS